MAPDDLTLHQQMQAGDDAALETIIRQYHAPIYRFLCRQTGDDALADDLAQETFTRLLTYEGQPVEHLKAWLFTVARNLAYDYFRSAAYRREQMTDFNDPAARATTRKAVSSTASTANMPQTHPETAFMQKTDRERIEAALKQLSAHQREVIILRFYHEMTIPDIARVIDVPAGTVKSRLFHAIKTLKGRLIQTGMQS